MIEDHIQKYISLYAESSVVEPPSETVALLRERPGEAFEAIAEYTGTLPNGLDPRDLGEPLGRLLICIADIVPDLMIERMSEGFWASRYLYICSAAASKSEVFAPELIKLLSDRSVYIKNLVLDLIAEYPHLQIPQVTPALERLSQMKSYQNDWDRPHLEKAMAAVNAHNNRMQSDAETPRR